MSSPSKSAGPPWFHLVIPVVSMLAVALFVGLLAWLGVVGLVSAGMWQDAVGRADPEEVVVFLTVSGGLLGLHLGALRSLRSRQPGRALALLPVLVVDLVLGISLVTVSPEDGESRLVVAIEADDQPAFEEAFEEWSATLTAEQRANFDFKNRPDLLVRAAGSGSERVARHVVSEASAVRSCDSARAFEVAVEAGHLDVIHVLIEEGLDVNAGCGACRSEPSVYVAAWSGDLAVLLTLLDAGGDPTCLGDDRSTPLMRAASLDHEDVVALLVEKGASPEATGQSGDTALVRASRAGSLASVEVLLAAGAAVDGAPGGRTPLMVASSGGHLEVVEALLRAGARVDLAPERTGSRTLLPVELASRRGHEAIVDALVEAGAPRPEPR